jgi:hypothetical protein
MPNTTFWQSWRVKKITSFGVGQLERDLWIQVANDGQVFDPELPPEKSKRVDLRLQLINSDRQISIPFTEADLAAKWCKLLQQVSPS